MADLTSFRVHFASGPAVLVDAETPKHAAEIIKARDPDAVITKIKRAKSFEAACGGTSG